MGGLKVAYLKTGNTPNRNETETKQESAGREKQNI